MASTSMADVSGSTSGAGPSSSHTTGPKVSSLSPVVLEEQRDASVGVSVGLHPLPIINISEHITRSVVQSGDASSKVYGVLLGTQAGRPIEVQTTFEIIVENGSVDHGFLQAKAAQFKQVFPTFEFLGWYCNGHVPTPADLDVHRQLTQYNESPLFLQVSPSTGDLAQAKASGELPIGIYETFVEVQSSAAGATSHDASTSSMSTNAQSGPAMYFRPAHYHVQTGEAERIAVDHASKPAESDGTGQSMLIANLSTQYNAIKMLADRVQVLRQYVAGVQAGTVPRDHESLRQMASIIACLPASGEIPEFHDEFLSEYNDLLLTNYLSDLTNGLHGLHELVDKFDAINQGNEMGMPGQGQRMRMARDAAGGRGKGARAARTKKGDSGMFA